VKLVEIYTSVQGEGPNTGRPTTFVRFGGCNLRCPGWGEGTLPDGSTVRGCDTVFAVYPEWRGSWESISSSALLERIPINPKRVCITGGEPLIQPREGLRTFVHNLIAGGYEIDLFTNGTKLLSDYRWPQTSSVKIVMDYKLPGSGEIETFKMTNWDLLNPDKDALKFVCKDRYDFTRAIQQLEAWQYDPKYDPPIYFGPVWGELDPGELSKWITEEFPMGIMNLQTHNYIWDPQERKR